MPTGYSNLTGLPIQLGRKHSEETKKIIGELKKGNKNCLGKHWTLSDEAKKNIGRGALGRLNKMKGRKLPDEWRNKIVASLIGHHRLFGKKQSVAHRINQSKRTPRGSAHYNWRGGINPLHDSIRKSLDFKLWREGVFSRDHWTCQACGYVGQDINAHHIKPFSTFPEFRFSLDNGITLCKQCHSLEHKVRR